MERDYNCKQIKTFLKRSGFSEDAATKTANKLNEARRVYPRLENIVENCCSCPNVDIRDLTIHEFYLANALSWVIKRKSVAVDAGSIELTKQEILHSDWFNTACQNPTLVASIMYSIAPRVINESIYLTKR